MFEPPYPPYDPTDKNGFSYETVLRRWPVILAGIVDQLSRENHALYGLLQSQVETKAKEVMQAKLNEGKSIIERVGKLKYQMARDHALEPIPPDGEPHVEAYNNELTRLTENGKNTWFTAPWLYAECYLYRFIRSLFIQSEHWKSYDPFASQKGHVFKGSSDSIYRIASIMNGLESQLDALKSEPDKLWIVFEDMLQMCLWGNATDLSLLTNMSVSDIARLQSTGKDPERQAFILKDDQHAVWQHLQTLRDARVDIILDNAGFELFTDLVFADFLVTHTPYVSKVIFHPKLIPWFVSDVTPPDFVYTLEALMDPTFLPEPSPEIRAGHLQRMIGRWRQNIIDGTFQLSVPNETLLGGGQQANAEIAQFWTAPWPYWDMKTRDPRLWENLRDSGLVIFKGDLK